MSRYSEDEKKALLEKDQNIDKKVFCPRCQKELRYHDFRTGYQIKCDTPNCLCATVRGI